MDNIHTINTDTLNISNLYIVVLNPPGLLAIHLIAFLVWKIIFIFGVNFESIIYTPPLPYYVDNLLIKLIILSFISSVNPFTFFDFTAFLSVLIDSLNLSI